jgi:hypothetical protein
MIIGEKTVGGKTWIRSNQVILHNPYKGERQVDFLEQKITELDDGRVLSEHAPGISFTFDPDEAIQIIHPETGLPIPGMILTQAQIMLGINSLYIKKASERGDI